MSHENKTFGTDIDRVVGRRGNIFASLYLALVVRNLALPESSVFVDHVGSFLLLFFVYEIILYIGGFWGRRVIPTAKNIFELLVPAHAMAVVVMVGYFYFLPSTGLSPKTNLVIFASILFTAMYAWKLVGLRLFTLYPIRAILIGNEAKLQEAFQEQPLWSVKIVHKHSHQVGLDTLKKTLADTKADTILVSFDRYPRIDILYKLMFDNISIIDTVKMKEEMDSKIDLEYIDQNWFLSHINKQSGGYRFIKRFMDVIAGAILLALCFIIAPILYIAVKIEDGGPVLITQKRIGLRDENLIFINLGLCL